MSSAARPTNLWDAQRRERVRCNELLGRNRSVRTSDAVDELENWLDFMAEHAGNQTAFRLSLVRPGTIDIGRGVLSLRCGLTDPEFTGAPHQRIRPRGAAGASGATNG